MRKADVGDSTREMVSIGTAQTTKSRQVQKLVFDATELRGRSAIINDTEGLGILVVMSGILEFLGPPWVAIAKTDA